MKTLQQLLKMKENIRMMKSQGSNNERNKLIEAGKRIGIDEIFRQNEIINHFKSQI